ILTQKGLPHRLARGPIEENDGDDELRQKQQIRQQAVIEDGGLFHAVLSSLRGAQATKQSIHPDLPHYGLLRFARNDAPPRRSYFAVFSKVRNMALPRATAASRAS